jgi:cytidylate kinase
VEFWHKLSELNAKEVKTMKICTNPYAITISHQIGSGGAVIGQKIAGNLEVPFIDRQVLHQVAEKLQLTEAELEGREGRLSSFWESLAHNVAVMDVNQGLFYDRYVPTDEIFFQEESETINRIAKNNQAVFIGRCGWYVLRNFPCRFSLLVTADRPTRIDRITALYGLSVPEAEKKIDTNDRERADYIRTFTKQDWFDARLYDLCINTSSIGMDQVAGLVLEAIKAKLAVLTATQK